MTSKQKRTVAFIAFISAIVLMWTLTAFPFGNSVPSSVVASDQGESSRRGDLSSEAPTDGASLLEEVEQGLASEPDRTAANPQSEQPHATQPVPWTPDAEWLARHESMTIAELTHEHEILYKQVCEEGDPELFKRLDAGIAEFLGVEQKYNGNPEDLTEITCVRMVPNLGTFRTVLPRSEFPDLYEKKDKAVLLNAMISKKQSTRL